MIEHDRLLELIKYEPDTGNFVWVKSRPGVRAGSVAGSLDRTGYRFVKIDYESYLHHRLAFFYVMGKWPENEMDHKNGDRANNKWSNLREATRRQNAVNRKAIAGLKGVEKQRTGKWIARIRNGGKKLYLGTFNTALEAHQVYVAKAIELHGEFVRIL